MTTNASIAESSSATADAQTTTTTDTDVLRDLAVDHTANGPDGDILGFDEFSAAFDATYSALETAVEEVDD